MYGKLFRQMYHGTLATVGPWQALITFQQLIVLADQDGTVDMTPEAISRETTVPLDLIKLGLEALEKPDPDSRTPDEEGRRIVRLADHRKWGWRIVNYQHYRQVKREEDRREYHRRYWHKRKASDSTPLNTTQQTQPSQPIAYAEAEAYAEASKTKRARRAEPVGMDAIRKAYPRRAGSHRWGDAAKHYGKRLAEGDSPETIMAGIERYRVFCAAMGLERTEKVQQAATFLGDNRGYLEAWAVPAKPESVQARFNRINGGHDERVLEESESGSSGNLALARGPIWR